MITDPLIAYLRTLQSRGIHHAPLDDGARGVLREWMIAARNKAHPPQPSPHTATPTSPFASIQEGALEDKLAALRDIAEHWAPAKKLGTLRDTMVFATGNPHCDLMFVGEAPGYQEELQREPFVGKAGEKLNGILTAMNIKREDIYISNIVKFRPSIPGQTTNNRAPSHEEITACLPIVTQEIGWIRPKAIVALGATAAKGLLGLQEATISSLRGKFHDFMGIPVRVTYHPSYLLRNDALSERRKVWEDMLAVMEQLSMPISDKQRAYFLPK